MNAKVGFWLSLVALLICGFMGVRFYVMMGHRMGTRPPPDSPMTDTDCHYQKKVDEIIAKQVEAEKNNAPEVEKECLSRERRRVVDEWLKHIRGGK